MLETTISLIGMEKVEANLGRFRDAVRDRMLKRSARKAITPIHRAAQANVPVDLGVLRDALAIKITSKGRQGEWVQAIMGPKTKAGVPVRIVRRGGGTGSVRLAIPTRYAHLVEFGHDIVVNGTVIGRVPPNAFMRKSWDAQGGEVALFRFEESMRKEVDAELASGNYATAI